MRIGIAHGTFATADAIGCDMQGMYDALGRVGASPVILCEHTDGGARGGADPEVLSGAKPPPDIDLLVYHHSIYSKWGAKLLGAVRCPLVFKYHNITPPFFFVPFSERYAALCESGIEQTQALISGFPGALWLADSDYNLSDLIRLGLDPGRGRVVPPFVPVSRTLTRPRTARYPASPYYGLFVGRLAPSKGHRLLLDVVACYMKRFPSHFVLRIVGGKDPALESYVRSLEAQVAAAGLEAHVKMLGQVSDDALAMLYASSHVYLNFSEHEGFCVPVVEAQAAGLPVVCTRSGASAETLGPQQLVGPLPESGQDLLFFARLIHEVLENAALREHVVGRGLDNVSRRFLREIVENRLLEALAGEIEPLCA